MSYCSLSPSPWPNKEGCPEKHAKAEMLKTPTSLEKVKLWQPSMTTGQRQPRQASFTVPRTPRNCSLIQFTHRGHTPPGKLGTDLPLISFTLCQASWASSGEVVHQAVIGTGFCSVPWCDGSSSTDWASCVYPRPSQRRSLKA